MQPVETGSEGFINGEFVAAEALMYGAFVRRSAADKAAYANSGDGLGYLGIVRENEVENKDNPGFYDLADLLPIKMTGGAKAWLMGGQTIQTGEFLKLAAFDGVLTPEATPETRTAASVARVAGGADTGDVGSADYDQVLSADADAGQKDVTLLAANLTKLALSVGDYVIVGDDNAYEINRVASLTSTTVTMQNALVATYDIDTASATLYKLVQVKVELV